MGKNNIISNLKDTDKVKLSYNDKDVEMTIEDFRRESAPYRLYIAKLSQSGTNAPVATVLENTLGETVTWSYDAGGSYSASIPSGFTYAKTSVQFTSGYQNNPSAKFFCYPYTDDVIYIECRTGTEVSVPADDELDFATIEIRVYN